MSDQVVWVLTSIDGEYEDAEEIPVRVYVDEATAKAMHAKLCALAEENGTIARWWDVEHNGNPLALHDLTEHLRTAAAALGFALADGYGLYSTPLGSTPLYTDHAELERRVIALLNAPHEADAAAHRRALDAVKVLFMRGAVSSNESTPSGAPSCSTKSTETI